MTLNCGVVAHPDDCLCDVVVGEPAPIMSNWVRDSWLCQEIVERLEMSLPWDNDKILLLLETQTELHDVFIQHQNRPIQKKVLTGRAAINSRNRSQRPEKINNERKQELKEMLRCGASAGDLKKHCANVYNIDISKSWANKLRVRLLREMGLYEVE